jgi:FKBP12-rapamycin complex-associated protein
MFLRHFNSITFQAVHTLVIEPLEDLDSWLELVSLCRKEGMHSLCSNLLRKLGAPLHSKKSPDLTENLNHNKVNDKVLLSTFQYWWSNGEKEKALNELTVFLKTCAIPDGLGAASHSYSNRDAAMFRVRCLLKKATWMRELEKGEVSEILQTLREARELAKDEYSVWHAWAVANYDQLKKAGVSDTKTSFDQESSLVPSIPVFISPTANSSFMSNFTPTSGQKIGIVNRQNSYITPKKFSAASGTVSFLNLKSAQQADKITPFVIEAIIGFVRSICLGQGQPLANLLQDTLRLLTLWFSYGSKNGVLQILETELEKISADNWLRVIPQLIARIHIKSSEISSLLRRLLVRVASAHPQALVWPISVALNTNDTQQKSVATEILMEMRKNRRQLVEEATTVSRELMKVAITPHELWYDGLEQAAQLYMDNKDVASMINTLMELHETLNDGQGALSEQKKPDGFMDGLGKIGLVSLRDVSFRHSYCKYLQDAYFWLDQFKSSGRSVDLHQAWEVYQSVFKKIKANIISLRRLELDHVSPALAHAKSLTLAVPGTYSPSSQDILITSFNASVHVISSKQRPRKITLLGSDGKKYQFLLKGHEDLRQDERVMQLFGLINACLNNDRITNDRGLNIVRYSVLPLSNNSGLIGWVTNCDTINQLVKQYREEKDIKLLTELKLLQGKSRNYDRLPLLHKVDLFKQVLDETTGEDLAKVLWLKSRTSDIWVERRANFTKSLAVMSMAGYILGLGDRHPSNLMLHRMSGQVVHIDFGDCFEITATRSKYPEIIPFRLTRMLTNCMDFAGMQGSYRLTCERVSTNLASFFNSFSSMQHLGNAGAS